MTNQHILIHISDSTIGETLAQETLRPEGFQVTIGRNMEITSGLIKAQLPDLLIIGDDLPDKSVIDWISSQLERYPGLPIILLARQDSNVKPIEALRIGVMDYLICPVQPNDILQSVRCVLDRTKYWREWLKIESQCNTMSLRKQLDELKTLGKIGCSVTASLDLDSILETVVDVAVEITNAEECSLHLLDEISGELYMRAARNSHENFVRTFRLPTHDTLVGEVLLTGKPAIIDRKTPKKIETSYLVHSLMYVPLIVKGKVIGVLVVDNYASGSTFNEHHLTLISAMTDYAAIAIENARLFTQTEIERNKLETILKNTEDCVIVAELSGRLVLVNHTARIAFGLPMEDSLVGNPVKEIFQNQDLMDIFDHIQPQGPSRNEITLEDGRVFNAQITPIPDVDLITIIMQDITGLKELDRIKSEFVNTVSHDLRSPLTAIVGYVDLIKRTGPLNDQQQEYIRRVQRSVKNITELINDLLDLGKIEAGLDTRFESLQLTSITNNVINGLFDRLTQKEMTLHIDVPEDLPPVLGNPLRLRQMVTNLVVNAIEYTKPGGRIEVMANYEKEQVILRVKDTGIGIPPGEQPFIFDKFFRANNVQTNSIGTGLGLSIVKSIVDNHQGRIWVDSKPGQGSTFTVVLPVAEPIAEA
jgi:two-component system, OmpR family, phosphate regulon sensor histidine kinase PhoR